MLLVRNPIGRRINEHRWAMRHRKFERLIEELSRDNQNFYVVQIGACDGVLGDPIHDLIRKYRWHGILVEPQKKEFDRLKINYNNESDKLIFENVAVADKSGPRILYTVPEEERRGEWQRGIASFFPWTDVEQTKSMTTELVECLTWDVLLDRHKVEHIDLLQIDAEGYDYQLLKMFDFNRMRPRLVRYEHMHLSTHDRRCCMKILKGKGYRLFEMKYDTGAVLNSQI